MQFISQHKIIVGLVVLIVIGGGWYYFTGSPADPTLAETPAALGAADQDLVTTLLTLRTVKLDATIFTDPAYAALRDFSTSIVPEAVGRPNPFAPLVSSTTTSVSTTRGAQIFQTRPKVTN